MREEFLAWQRTDDNIDKNPYHDRYVTLSSSLNLSLRSERHLLGRAIYHLAQRRGFLSNRKEEQTANAESGKVKDIISRLSDAMAKSSCEYIGEFFYKCYRNGEKIRTGEAYGYTHRTDHYEKEFNAICDKQNLSDDLRKALYRAIFFQRPLKSQKSLVGNCTFETDKSRCPISHPRFEEYRVLSFINNIKIQTSRDRDLRALTAQEIRQIEPLFYRKSKPNFDFEDIAKKLSGGRKGSYGYLTDRGEIAYRFNFRTSTLVAGSPVTTQLRTLFGEEWLDAICERYLKAAGKSREQILNDIWHVLFGFDDECKLREWAALNLQLDEVESEAFAKIVMPQGYAALSLNAINKILPWLRAGYRYDEAVFAANLPSVVPAQMWSDENTRQAIVRDISIVLGDYNPKIARCTKKQAIDQMLLDNYGIDNNATSRLYEPSRVETFAKVQPDESGELRLGSPRTSSVRNPMAMRALFRLRALINRLLQERKIDPQTKINIEFARGLNDTNKRKAIEYVQRENEKRHNEYAESIKKLYREQCGVEITPTDDDILKYQLWEEQNHICLYSGNSIRICDFIGANPLYDIEHTVPRSRGGDNSQINKTLCECDYNRRIKGGKLPSELADHSAIMERVESLGWNDKIRDLHRQIERTRGTFSTKEIKDAMIQRRHRLMMQLDYWSGKLKRFEMEEVPEGFSNRQGVDIGIIGRYAKMYLETLFCRVYTVKGATTADFRKMWGLQEEYSHKERTNHIHHCIDAITIACIGRKEYDEWAHYQRREELYRFGRGERPQMPKPWHTFTEDVKAIADQLLVSHHTYNNLPKHSCKKLRVRGKVQLNSEGNPIYCQGDTARGALHMQTFYGAIKRDDEIKYVVRKSLSSLQQSDVDKIVDDAVRECVRAAIVKDGFKEAISKPICFNPQKGVYIKKVRIFTPSVTNPIHLKKHRDSSVFEHKRYYHVINDSNYCMAIYEGEDAKGRIKRTFRLVNNLEATKFYNGKTNRYDLVPQSDDNDYPLKYILRAGTMVLFYETSPDEIYECSKSELSKRLYKVTGFSTLNVGKNSYGRLTFRFHQEARPAGELKAKNGEWKVGEEYRAVVQLCHTQLNALVEGCDFELSVTGEIKFKH